MVLWFEHLCAYWTGALILGALAVSASAQNLQCADLSGVAPLPNVRFEQDVLPIIEDALWGCTNCHGSSAGLSLDQGTASHQNLFCADTQGSVPQPSAKRVVPGAPLESWFYLRVACDDIDDQSFRMPRFGSPLPSAELRVIYDWILQGALSAETIFTSRFDSRGFCP